MKTLLCSFFLLCHCLVSRAQWTTDVIANTLVSTSASDDCMSKMTPDGKTYIVFWKSVPAPVNYELRVQLLDARGNRKFADEGLLVTEQMPMGTFTMLWDIAVDDSAYLYIAASSTQGTNPGYAFKVDTTGALAWGSGGIQFSPTTGLIPRLCPLAGGQVAIAWFPGSGVASLQRFTASGAPVWANPVSFQTSTPTQITYPGNVFPLSGNKMLMVFHGKSGPSINSNLWAQLVDADGNPHWPNPVQLSDKATRFNTTYSFVQDADTIFYGFSAATGLRFDAFVQRINPGGSTWGLNGADLDVSQNYYEMDVRLASQPGSGSVWAACRYTNTNQSQYGERVQRFSRASGERQLGDGAAEVFPLDDQNRNHAGDLLLMEGHPLMVFKQGLDNGASPVELHGIWLDDAGLPLAPAFPVATFPASKGRISVNGPLDTGAVVVFTEEKAAGEKRIYAQYASRPQLTSGSKLKNAPLFRVWPNPASYTLMVSSEGVMEEICLFNALGQTMATVRPDLGQKEMRLSLASMAAGLYRLQITDQTGQKQQTTVVVE